MNAKYIPSLLVLAFLCMFSTSAFAQAGDGAQMTNFKFTDAASGEVIHPGHLGKNKPVVVMYFDPWCDHCQMQAGWINEEIEKFDDVTVLFVAFTPKPEDIVNFRKEYLPKSVDRANFLFALDADYNFDTFFGYSEVPSIYVYNNTWKRVAAFKEETKIEEITKYFK